MCGIAGFWKTERAREGTETILQGMLSMLHHRGPDGYGHHISPEDGLAMGHARLSIIDLEGGNQPLFSPDKNKVLTVNGEFYGFKPARAQLVCEGRRFGTKSDSEIALHLYERDGLDFVRHLRGEFAVALYDREEEQLILMRDRFGIKPLFYRYTEDGVYYGSEVKALLAHPEVPRELSHESVLNQLMQTMVPGTSAFKGIYAVKPGHMVIIRKRNGRLEMCEQRYWDMEFPEEQPPEAAQPDQTYIDGVRDKLIESIQLRLEADVPVGCYLSGGIDSCSILGLATALRQDPVKAFTISFDDDQYDESSIAQEMARFTGADQVQMNLSGDDLYGESYVDTLWHAERTFYNTLGVAKWHMSRVVRENGYKVVVTGEGSDELFGGYPAFKRDMFLHGTAHLPESERKIYQQALDRNNALFRGAILSEKPMSHPAFESLCGFTPSWIQPWMLTLEMARPLLHDDVLAELKDYDPVSAIAEQLDPRMIEGRHPLDKAQYTWIKTMLEGQILNWGGDRVDMAHSVESRPAFLDHHVAEYARLIPQRLRVYGNIEKWVLREAMREILPEVLYKREKFAFMAPPGNTQQGKRKALRSLIAGFMGSEQIEKTGLFDRKRLEGFIEGYFSEEDPVQMKRQDALMNHILGLHILHRHFIQPDLPRRAQEMATPATR